MLEAGEHRAEGEPVHHTRQEAARHGTSHVAGLIEHHDSKRCGDEPETGIALQRFKTPGVSAARKIRDEARLSGPPRRPPLRSADLA